MSISAKMRLFLLFVGISLISFPRVIAQSAGDPDNGQTVVYNSTTEDYDISWWGYSGRTYFIQHSLDLLTWTHLSEISTGGDSIITISMESPAANNFWRISSIDKVSSNPGAADFDGDGLSNSAEISYGTDPLKADTDGDGVPDGVEYQLGTNPKSSISNTSDPTNSLALKVHTPTG